MAHQEIDYTEFADQYLYPFQNPSYIFDDDIGFIVWRFGTGLNIELLHIRAWEVRKGYGTTLFHRMLNDINQEGKRPYYSIYGFSRTSNERASEFYLAMGFTLQRVDGLYGEGSARMFYQDYDKLIAKMVEVKQRKGMK